jgi:hypothetical protein
MNLNSITDPVLLFPIFILLSSGVVLYSIFKPSTSRLQRFAAVIGVTVLIFVSFRCGSFVGRMTTLADHTRFVKELFYRLSDAPPKTLHSQMVYLSSEFYFPTHYSEEGSKEQEDLFNTFSNPDNAK